MIIEAGTAANKAAKQKDRSTSYGICVFTDTVISL